MNHRSLAQDVRRSQLKQLIADMFRMDLLEPDKIADRAPLVGGSLGLDSLDVLELAFCIEETFGVTIYSRDGTLRAFASIASLADFIDAGTTTRPLRSHRLAHAEMPFEVLTSPAPV